MKYRVVNTAGQNTAIITTPTKSSELPMLAKKIMLTNRDIDQVGYLSGNRFTMMGGELSINGTLAAASLVQGGNLINGYQFYKLDDMITVSFPKTIVRMRLSQLVIFNGISYLLIPAGVSQKKVTFLQKIVLNLLTLINPASGIIYYTGAQIIPLIYVRATNTYVWEAACGSGSVACSLVSGVRQVKQPSGESLSIAIDRKFISITTSVKEL
jgi:hypothetical protein